MTSSFVHALNVQSTLMYDEFGSSCNFSVFLSTPLFSNLRLGQIIFLRCFAIVLFVVSSWFKCIIRIATTSRVSIHYTSFLCYTKHYSLTAIIEEIHWIIFHSWVDHIFSIELSTVRGLMLPYMAEYPDMKSDTGANRVYILAPGL